jgi:N-methylhydantoinase A
VITADVVKDLSRTVMLETKAGIAKNLDRTFRDLESTGRRVLRQEGFPESKQRFERSLAMRYKGQSFELQIAATGKDLNSSFHRAHKARYGYAQESNTIEIVSARVRCTGVVEPLREKSARAMTKARFSKPAEYTSAYFGTRKLRTGVYRREDLSAGAKLHTPCIVTEYSATTLIPSGTTAVLDTHGNLIIASS